MPKVSVQSNVKEVMADLALAQRELKDVAIVRALNRTVENVRAEAVRKIRDTYVLNASTVRDQMYITRAWTGRLEASITASGKPIPLISFNATWRQKWPGGARFSVRRGARKSLPDTFIATMRSGHVGVFERTGRKRLPIEEKFSIGVPGMFGAKQVQDTLEQVADDRFTVNLNQQLKFLFKV